MARFRTTFAAVRDPDSAFTYLSDFSHATEWDPGVRAASRLDDGPLRVGSRFSVDAAFLGRVLALEYAITAFEPSHRVVFEAEIPFGRSVDEITFHPKDTGTMITYDADLRLAGFAKVIDPFMGVALRKIGNRARAGLVRTLG